MAWQLIETKIVGEHKLDVNYEDVLNRTKELFQAQMSGYGNAIGEEELQKAAQDYLAKNKEEGDNIYRQLMGDKMLVFLKENVNLKTKAVSFDDFVKLATGKPAKKGILESLSNLVKM